MFDVKEYHKKYMRKYREEVIKKSPHKLNRIRELDRLRYKEESKNLEYLEKERHRKNEQIKEKRKDPAYRKLAYKRHTEWARRNRDYINTKQRERNKKPENKIKVKAHNLKKYGLSYDDYQLKIKNQKGKCPICNNVMTNGYVDHNHTTGQVRDLLCNACNRWIGFIEKYPHLVKPMVKYLKKWEKLCGIMKQTQ